MTGAGRPIGWRSKIRKRQRDTRGWRGSEALTGIRPEGSCGLPWDLGATGKAYARRIRSQAGSCRNGTNRSVRQACFVVRDANGFPVTANLVYHSACLFFAVILCPATCLSYDPRELLHLRAIRKSYLTTPRHLRGEWPRTIARAQSLRGSCIVFPGIPSD